MVLYLTQAIGISVCVCIYLYWGRGFQQRSDVGKSKGNCDPKAICSDRDESRDIIHQMEKSQKNCVVFFGSQTGTAEGYALRLAKEGNARFALDTMAANLEDYDLDNLNDFPKDKVAIFVMATYGEGEPPDSAVAFFDLINGDERAFTTDAALSNLTYAAFGLGNKTYEHYNAVIQTAARVFDEAGATRIGEVGMADDGAGTTEEDYLDWKETMWSLCARYMGASEQQSAYAPSFRVTESPQTVAAHSVDVYLGEPNRQHLVTQPRDITGPFNAHNPFISPVHGSRELLSAETADRNCIHMDLDIAGSGLTYEAGDHAAIWPSNATSEVDGLLRVLGLREKAGMVIDIEPVDPLISVPFPTPTTYEAVFRHYLEIAGPVSRQLISNIASFAPTEEAKGTLSTLAADKDMFHDQAAFSTLYSVLERCAGREAQWTGIPFSLLIEGLPRLQPRFYSISSSPLMQPNLVSLTVAVKSEAIPNREDATPFCGVASNYLLAVSRAKSSGLRITRAAKAKYDLGGPRGKLLQENSISIAVHIRRSNFKLPQDTTVPIIMIGPGTGVAPFRGFVQERAKQVSVGSSIGPMMLFFGSRERSEDFIYEEEWKEHNATLGPHFELHTAFSRETEDKVYVQHVLAQQASRVYELLSMGAFVYVCGDAKHMAKDVQQALMRIISDGASESRVGAEETIHEMKLSGHYQEDVWA